MVGAVGAGGCSLVLQRMAALTDDWLAWIQLPALTGELYPPAVAAMNIPLWRLLLVRVTDPITALRAAETLLRGGATKMLAIDVGPDPRPWRLSTYHRLRRQVLQTDAALTVVTPKSIVPADFRIELAAHGDRHGDGHGNHQMRRAV